MNIIPQLTLVLILVFLNGFFVASEFALVAVRKTRIDELVKKGNKSAKLVQKSLIHLDTYISATQLGITLASLALGWIGEPAIAHFLKPFLNDFLPDNLLFISANVLAISIAFGTITFLHIVLGELAPKTIALQKAENISLLIIGPLTLFATVFKPFIWILNEAGNLVLKIIGFKAPSGHQLVHSEEEIKMILAQSVEQGAIEKEEAEMVYSVLKLADTPVSQIMVPRIKVVAFEKNTPINRIIKITQKNTQSRFPVYDISIDNIIGFIHIKDIYRNLVSSDIAIQSLRDFYRNILRKKGEKSLAELKIIRKIPHISESTRIDDVMLEMRRKRVHIAVVDDNDGGTAGVVSLEDVVESLVGEIQDEFEELDKDLINKR